MYAEAEFDLIYNMNLTKKKLLGTSATITDKTKGSNERLDDKEKRNNRLSDKCNIHAFYLSFYLLLRLFYLKSRERERSL